MIPVEYLEVYLEDGKPNVVFELVWYSVATVTGLPNQFDFEVFMVTESNLTIF